MKARRARTVPAKQIRNAANEGGTFAHDLSDQGDLTLVAAAKNQNRQAFEVLVERHARRIFYAVRHITRTQEDAEDVVQQSLQKAFVHLNQFAGKSSFSTWLTRIAINEALILLRKRRGSREMSINDSAEGEGELFALDIPDAGQSPEEDYSRRERQHILLSAMKRLPHGTRRAIQLRELDERSTAETAKIMGISIGAVKARVFHGRRKLRERLKRYAGAAWTTGSGASRALSNKRHISQNLVACDACG